jgi:hypothetical protein
MFSWLVLLALIGDTPPVFETSRLDGAVRVELFEGFTDKKNWEFSTGEPTERFAAPAFGLVGVPKKYSAKGLVVDRSNPFLIRAAAKISLPAGEHRLLLRARGAARLILDGRVVLQTEFLKPNSSGHEAVPELPATNEEGLHALPVGHQERLATLKLDGGEYDFRLEAIIGGPKLRPELCELLVGVAPQGEPFRLLSPTRTIPLSEEGWAAYAAAIRAGLTARDHVTRQALRGTENPYWQMRHELARKEWQDKPAPAIPEVTAATPVHNAIDRFSGARLEARKVIPAPLTDDLTFLRRASLDTVGVIPTPREIEGFLRDDRPDRRARAVDRLLADPRWADHWVGYWQDVLAENPGIVKPTLNNTGPFRWWIHQAFFDNLPVDRFVTELVMMEGSRMGGGPAGFGIATENDAPMAAKADILAKAFLGVEMQCARCHDAPYHPYKQKDLFSLAAMLGKGTQTLPPTSTVRFAEGTRRPLVQVTLQPGDKIDPAWPFAHLAPADIPPGVLREPANPRERLAAVLTSPRNERFAQVMVNRLWKRYLGWGLVEPVDDWTKAKPSHPELLAYLGRELVTHAYDLKHVARLILTSHTYQRAIQPEGSKAAEPEDRLFASPARRRMSAEQLVDSLFLAAGKEYQCEELTMDPEGRRPITEMINLGLPRRAWEFTSLSNERDRPALALPVAQSIVDVLAAFGWRDSRQNPLTVRDETPTPLQPLILANGMVGSRIARLSDDSAMTQLCLGDRPVTELVEAVFLRILTRPPTAEERQLYTELLKDGYAERRVDRPANKLKRHTRMVTAVSWANHLSPEATRIKLEMERAARAGDPPTERLQGDWRERMEDMLWSLVNSPEFLFVP